MLLSKKAPDTITSWIISAFAIDPVTGLGIAPDTAKVCKIPVLQVNYKNIINCFIQEN